MNVRRLLAEKLYYPLKWLTLLRLYLQEITFRFHGDIQEIRRELSPIFIIGANRSGTSLVSFLLSQHPDVEGLFRGNKQPDFLPSGHANGYAESMHIWRHFIPRQMFHDIPLWGLPGRLRDIYRGEDVSEAESRRLAVDLHLRRKTNRVPLLKNNLSTLKVGLITKVFPDARFVLVFRPLDSYLTSTQDKWRKDGWAHRLQEPLTAMHWQMVNTIARYELEIHAPGRYAEINLSELNGGNEQVQRVLSLLCGSLALSEHRFDLKQLRAPENTGKESDLSRHNTEALALIPDTVRMERDSLQSSE